MNGSQGPQIIINVHEWMGTAAPISLVTLESPVIAGDGKLTLLESSPQDEIFQQLKQGLVKPAVVRDAGHQLYQQLTANPAIRQTLENAMLQAQGIHPIYINIRSNEAEELPWEALCTAPPPKHRFLSLEERWPVARIATPTVNTEDLERFMESRLRFLAVLSAAGVPAAAEWEALREALLQPGREIEVLVLVGEQKLKKQIEEQKGTDSRINVEFVPQFSEDLTYRIRMYAPHILHFFCHGSTEDGPHLQIATGQDWLGSPVGSTIHLEINGLERVDPSRLYTWLVTLNCCLGAVPLEQAPSLARGLVERGFPAAIGMREVLSELDAPVFCRRFYESILDELDDRLRAGNRRFELNWAKLLPRPRRGLYQHRAGGPPPLGPEQLKEWTLPILYVPRLPFRLRRPSTNQTLSSYNTRLKQSELTQLRAKHAQLARLDTPDAALNEISKAIRKLENELYPA